MTNGRSTGDGRSSSRRIGWRTALAVSVVVVLGILVAAQLVLPSVASRRARAEIERYGQVHSLTVDAFPAIELLWGQMDSLRVQANDLNVGVDQIGPLLSRARDSQELRLTSPHTRITSRALTDTGLVLRDVSLFKHGEFVDGHASLSAEGIQAALPPGVGLQPISSANGQVEVRATGALFGVTAAINASISASEGKLVVQPSGLLFGDLVKVTLFSDPRIYVEAIEARTQPGGYRFTVDGRLR